MCAAYGLLITIVLPGRADSLCACLAELLICKGPCLRAFHAACLDMPQPADTSPAAQAAWFCPECLHGRVRCFVCGEFGAGFEDPTMRKCSLGVCGRFYHIKYAPLEVCSHAHVDFRSFLSL